MHKRIGAPCHRRGDRNLHHRQRDENAAVNDPHIQSSSEHWVHYSGPCSTTRTGESGSQYGDLLETRVGFPTLFRPTVSESLRNASAWDALSFEGVSRLSQVRQLSGDVRIQFERRETWSEVFLSTRWSKPRIGGWEMCATRSGRPMRATSVLHD
jgi:hypothetical protein